MPEALGGCIGVVLHALVLALAATLLWLSCRRIIAKNIRIERASACVVMFVALMLAVYSVQIRDLLLLYLC
jgi:Ca2+/Na+ antiporter